MNRDYQLEKTIAESIGYETEMLSEGFGFTLYLVNKDAVQDGIGTSNVNIIGGSWKKFKTEDGETVERFGRRCPAWSIDLKEIFIFLKSLNQTDSEVDFIKLRERLMPIMFHAMGYGPESAANSMAQEIADFLSSKN